MNEKNTQNVIPNVDSKKKEERNVPDLRFKGFVNDWIISNIDNEFLFLNNNSFSRDNLNYNHGLKKNIHYGDILTKYETVKNPIDNDVPYINDNIKTSNGLTELISGDIVLADTAEDYIVGKAIEIYNPNSLKLYSGLHTIALRPKNKFSIGYLAYYFNSYYHKKRMFPLIQGIKVYSISKSALSTLLIKFPDLEEQEKISRLLIKIDNRIVTQKKIIEDLNTLIDSIIDRLFFDNDYNVKLSDVITQSTNRNKNELINCVSSVSNKYGFIKQSEQFEDRDVASDDLTNYKVITLNDFGYNPARINVGSIARYKNTNNTVVSPMYICFKCVNNLYPEYLEYYFKSKEFKIHLLRRLEGSVRQCLTFESMQNIPFHLPDLDEQKKNAKIISVFFKKIQLETSILSKLILQKDYLLSKMFI